MTDVLFGPAQISIEFAVPGRPVSQGSHTPYVRMLFVAVKSRLRCPRCKVPLRASCGVKDETVGLDEWRTAVGLVAGTKMRGISLMHGSLLASMDFVVARPKDHYRTGRYAHLLKPDAPAYPNVKPDLSKLLRAAEDAMTGVVWVDDAQVVEYGLLRKRYADEPGDQPGVRIVVTQIA